MAGILAGIGIPVLISAVSETLKNIETPLTQGAAKALEEVNAAINSGQISDAQLEEANRHSEKMAEIEMQQSTATTSEVNQSLRAEISSEDKYVRRMRPTFGYVMAVTWGAQMIAIAYVIVFETSKAFMVLNAVESLTGIWAMGLSVLGVYVYKRSQDKKLNAPTQENIVWNKS